MSDAKEGYAVKSYGDEPTTEFLVVRMLVRVQADRLVLPHLSLSSQLIRILPRATEQHCFTIEIRSKLSTFSTREKKRRREAEMAGRFFIIKRKKNSCTE